MNAGRRFTSADFLWLGLVLMIVLGLAFLLPIRPQDYWWYVRLGRDILQTGAVPTVDTLSAQQAGQPIVYQSWLSAVLFWLLYQAGGIPLSALARGLVLAISYGLVFELMRESGTGPRLAALLAFLGVLASSNNWSVRPQLFAYPLFILSWWALRRWNAGSRWSVWSLPFLGLFWVNLHGSFVLLFVLVGAAIIFGSGSRRDLLCAAGITAMVTFVNPYGAGMWRAVISTFFTPEGRNFSAEWLPPVNSGWQMNLFFGWLLLFAPLAAWSPARLSRLDWVWFLGFAWLALSGLRYVVWFELILTVSTAQLLADWGLRYLDRPRSAGFPALDVGLGLAFLLLPLAMLPGLRDRWWSQAPPALALSETPATAVSWLEAHPELPGPLWSDIAFSSYLTFALPSRPVWVDTRFQVAYTPEQLARYKAVHEARYDWQALLDQDGINLLLVSVAEQADLLGAVGASPAWCEAYRDEVAVVFRRCEQESR